MCIVFIETLIGLISKNGGIDTVNTAVKKRKRWIALFNKQLRKQQKNVLFIDFHKFEIRIWKD